MATHAHTTTERRPEAAASGPGRRSLCGAVTALACAPVLGAAPVRLADAGLLRLCAAFHDAQARTLDPDAADTVWESWLARRYDFEREIEATSATTDAGRLAKARIALVLMEEAADLNNDYERFTLTALRELVGGAA